MVQIAKQDVAPALRVNPRERSGNAIRDEDAAGRTRRNTGDLREAGRGHMKRRKRLNLVVAMLELERRFRIAGNPEESRQEHGHSQAPRKPT